MKMGVKFLLTFMRELKKEVNIVNEINDFLRKEGSEPIILVDGFNFIHITYRLSGCMWQYGGQLKQYEMYIYKFIKKFLDLKVKMIFYFDGLLETNKINEWIIRKEQNMKKINELYDLIENGLPLNGKDLIIPRNVMLTTFNILKNMGCKVVCSVYECDLEMYLYTQRENCFAYLVGDTDFIIFGGTKHCWFLSTVDLKNMTIMNYDRKILAESLKIEEHQLPLFASLAGNDFVPLKMLETFHKEVLGIKDNSVNRTQILYTRLGEYINKKWPRDKVLDQQLLKRFALNIFCEQKGEICLKNSIDFYNGVKDEMNLMLSSNDKTWREVTEMIYLHHVNKGIIPSIFSISCCFLYYSSMVFEDLRNSDLPPCQKLQRELRKRIYNVIFYERPGVTTVKELVIYDLKLGVKQDNIYSQQLPEGYDHPGLCRLWQGNYTFLKWNLLGHIIGINKEKVKILKNIPKHLVVPAASFRFLMDSKVKLYDWEIKVAVASAVLLQHYSCDDLSNLYVKQCSDTRPFRLYTLITCTFSSVILGISCISGPLSSEEMSPTYYQDGKLFHHKYQQAQEMKMQNSNNFDEIITERKALGAYNTILKFLFS